jgi:hypothetical protein
MGRTNLDLEATPKIPAALLTVPPECADGRAIEKYPAVAALCFVVAALDFHDRPSSRGTEEAYTDNSERRETQRWNRNLPREGHYYDS